MTFRVFRDASTTVLGTTLSYWESDIADSLFYALYPEENWPDVLTDHSGFKLEINPLRFDEDIISTSETLKQIVNLYDKYHIDIDMIPRMEVAGRYMDTERLDGVTISSLYQDGLSKELIYQGLFEYKHIANINEDSIKYFMTNESLESMKKRYLCWAMENGLLDICEKYSLDERRAANGYEYNNIYFAVIDGEVTGENEEIYADYKGNLPYSSFYKVLVRQGFPVEGNWYHFKFTGIDGKEYEFGYDQCSLVSDNISSQGANDKNYARTFNCYYYVCDSERYIRNNLKFEDRKSTRYDTQWNPEVYVAQIKEMTGLDLSSTYKDPKNKI